MPTAIVSNSGWFSGRVVILTVLVTVWGLITHGTYAGSGDEPHYMMTAHSIAFDQDLDLRNNYRDATLIGNGTLEPGLHARERNGKLLPVHDIGWSFVLAPAVWLAYPIADHLGDVLPSAWLKSARLNKVLLLRHQMSLLVAILTALLAREIFYILISFGATNRQAFAWSLLFALSPPILSHSFLVFTELPSAMLATAVVRRVLFCRLGPRGLAVLGAAIGFLFLLHVRNVGLVIGLTGLTAYFCLKGSRSRMYWSFVGGLTLLLAIRTALNYHLWGTLLTTPHASFQVTALSSVLLEAFVRLTGLVYDREYGLLAYAPIYLLALPAWVLFAQERRQHSLGLLAVVVSYLLPILLPITNVHGWTGGWSPPARFLVPIVGLLWLPLALYWRQALPKGRAVIGIAALFQVAVNAYLWQSPRLMWNDGDGTTAFALAAWLPSWAEGATWAFAICVGFSVLLTLALIRARLAKRLVANRTTALPGEP